MEVITIENEAFVKLIKRIDELLVKVDTKVTAGGPEKENSDLNITQMFGDKLLTSKEVCQLFKITNRTLGNYRDKFLMPYVLIGKKYLYKSRDIEDFLKNKYLNAEDI